MKSLIPKLFSLIVILFIFGCNGSRKDTKDSTEGKGNEVEAINKTDVWAYQGETGPKFWTRLEEGSECGGIRQSPININTFKAIAGDFDLRLIDFHYENATKVKNVINNGHTIEYEFESENNILKLAERQYILKQFHFHSPSEHTLDGVRFPLEIHMVHFERETNSYVVLALFAKQGETSKTFRFLLDYLPIDIGESKEVSALCGFEDPLSALKTGTLYHYEGSLTTPPCTESVSWYILKEPLGLAPEQIDRLKDLMPINNYRLAQPLNGRIVSFKTFN